MLHTSTPTVQRTRRRFVEGGLDRALNEDPRPGARKKLDGKGEALLETLAKNEPPEGRKQKRLILQTVHQAQQRTGEPLTDILKHLGVSRTTYYRWVERLEEGCLEDKIVVPHRRIPPPTPREIDLVCSYALMYPKMGYKRLTFQMIDEDVAYLKPYQGCVVHVIRNSLKYVSYKDRKEFSQDMKGIYKAPTEEGALMALQELERKWADKHPLAVRVWRIRVMFRFTPQIRRLIYTTNIIESYLSQLGKVTKNRRVFPNDVAVQKLVYLVSMDVVRRWTAKVRGWNRILAQLAIHFQGKLEGYL